MFLNYMTLNKDRIKIKRLIDLKKSPIFLYWTFYVIDNRRSINASIEIVQNFAIYQFRSNCST